MKLLLLLLTIGTVSAYDTLLIDGPVYHKPYWDKIRLIGTIGTLETYFNHNSIQAENSYGLSIERMISPCVAFSVNGTTANYKNYYLEDSHTNSLGAGFKFFVGENEYFRLFAGLGASHYWNDFIFKSNTIRFVPSLGLHLMLGDTLGLYGDIKTAIPVAQLSGEKDTNRLFSANFGLIVQI